MAGDADVGLISESERFPWRRKWQPNSSILAWEIPWTEEPGRLQSIESRRGGHDSTSEHALTYFTTITKERGKGGLWRLRNFSTEKGHLNVPRDLVTICILGSQEHLSVLALYYMMKHVCSFHIFHGELERCFVTLHHWHPRSYLLGFLIDSTSQSLCTRWSSRLVLIRVNRLHLRTWHLHLEQDLLWGFPCVSVYKNLPCNAGHVDLIPGQGTKDPTFHGSAEPRATTEDLVCHS